jgi:Dehydrogenases with different specificities (related to short-chain alcohol dehydrogenases)
MSEAQKVIIGGISGGVGSALAKRLHVSGWQIAGFARNEHELVKLREALPGVETAVCDATDAAAVGDVMPKLIESIGGVDAYVHAIGSIFIKPAHLTKDEDWAATLNTNLNSGFYALRAVLGPMQKQQRGSCLFFSTAAAQVGIANHEAIAAAKGGIEAMVRSAAATYASRGIRVNAIAPSLTETPLSRPLIGSEQGLEISKKMHPLGQIGQPEDVASLAEWLVSGSAGFVTGQTFVMDGGVSTIVPKPRI